MTNQFKPLHSWRDELGEILVYATSFFFGKTLGLLYQYIDGRFSVIWEKEEYDSTKEDIEECLGSELYSAVLAFIEDNEWCEDEVDHTKVIRFEYNGIQGSFDKSKDLDELTYNGKVYKFYPAAELRDHEDTSFFTEDDIDLLIFLRDKLDQEAFPFKNKLGEVTYLFLNKNWLLDIAIRLLKTNESFQMFFIKGSTLFINGVEFDYKSKCRFSLCEYGEYSYTIPVEENDSNKAIYVSAYTKSGCHIDYLPALLTIMPLKWMSGTLDLEEGVNIDERGSKHFYATTLHNIPISRMASIRSAHVGLSGLELYYELERVIDVDFEY